MYYEWLLNMVSPPYIGMPTRSMRLLRLLWILMSKLENTCPVADVLRGPQHEPAQAGTRFGHFWICGHDNLITLYTGPGWAEVRGIWIQEEICATISTQNLNPSNKMDVLFAWRIKWKNPENAKNFNLSFSILVQNAISISKWGRSPQSKAKVACLPM